MVTKKRGLGRGLEALLGSEKKPAQGAMLDELPIEWIKPGKFQPRKTFNEQALKDLAASIRNQGLVQPIVVREIGPSTYEIIAGERRWRAAQKAEMIKIPAIIKQVDDKSVVAMSLIENVQREDLNPIEQAQALQRRWKTLT
jgi:ParB family chromosome partitioning protein